MDVAWPFDDPMDVEVFVLGRVLRGESPLRLVTHDEDDGSWQFLDGDHVVEDDATVVTLFEMVQVDPGLLALADLPLGWFAWRLSVGESWRRGIGEPPADLLPAIGTT